MLVALEVQVQKDLREQKSEVTFLPDFAAGTTQSDYDMERSVMASQVKKRSLTGSRLMK